MRFPFAAAVAVSLSIFHVEAEESLDVNKFINSVKNITGAISNGIHTIENLSLSNFESSIPVSLVSVLLKCAISRFAATFGRFPSSRLDNWQ